MVGGGFRVGVCPVSLACLVRLVCLVRAADSAECAAFAAPEASGLLPGAGKLAE